jgi:phage-related protein
MPPRDTPDLTVFITSRNATCDECHEDLGRGAWITLGDGGRAFCLACADLDQLVFLPAGDAALTRRIVAVGPNLGSPHTNAVGNELFELRLKGQEGIARVFFCTHVGRRVIVLHAFVKKTQKTPKRDIEIARKRMKEVKHANP